ncbi:bifunctional riboflavin kinase/FAD synthetase [Trichloromonas acetexigens]|uniref:Riboflavin biosynthesis protein n=1 Tax=Trichloromonas acetexigens TaxID=38815 RepID=A0A550JHU4_9BACT|nr:bifunctional riboflavin kinase/FAD synthetase [Desulfuromonas acetexigens]TRO82792.1 bifunctional riboflavin kinase/FAD synthetase [Desulfuromonas acetexigens]
MKIIRDLQALTTPPRETVLTIGNFDGVHLGHREIFRRVVRKARSIGGTAAVLTFDPHPLKILAPEQAPKMLNTRAEKELLIAASRIDLLVCLPFTRELSLLTAEEFVQEVLVEKLAVRHLIVGYDYAFGRGRLGNLRFLQEQGRKIGFTVEVLEPLAEHNVVYSSSLVRNMISAGDVAGVVRFLGRHYTLEGVVAHGAERGRKLGFPTANLVTEKELLPIPGVYAVKVRRGRELYDGVLNIGWNPTFGNQEVTVEVHLLDFSGDLYGETLRVYFYQRLRNEKRFPSLVELCQAIAADIAAAREILGRRRLITYREYLDTITEPEPPGSGLGEWHED